VKNRPAPLTKLRRKAVVRRLVQKSNLVQNYRAEIDGLRAVAVLLVLGFHLNLPGFTTGYLGVDAFFVISGFLITEIILRQQEAGRFTYKIFLWRRVMRLLPALGVVTTATALGGWLLFDQSQLLRLGNSILGVALYVSNFVFMFESDGYFAVAAETAPLLHTWTLGVEEQFYLIFPLFMIAIAGLSWANRTISIIVLTSISSLVWVWVNDFQPLVGLSDYAFFMLPTRAWEFGIGALAALILKLGGLSLLTRRLRLTMTLSGVFLVAVGLLQPDSLSLGKGISTVSFALGLGFLLLTIDKGLLKRALSNSFLVAIGLLSYSIYLWHYPILAFIRTTTGRSEPEIIEVAGILVATFGLAYLTTRFVENPIRFAKPSFKRVIWIVSLFVVPLLAIGFVTRAAVGEGSLERVAAAQLNANSWIYFTNMDERLFQVERLRNPPSGVSELVFGSSRLMQVGEQALGSGVLNLSVSGASLPDFYGIVPNSLEKTGAQKILLGVDPWLLNENSNDVRWKEIEARVKESESRVDSGFPLEMSPDDLGGGSVEEEVKEANVFQRLLQFINVRSEQIATSLVAGDGNTENRMKKAKDGVIIYDLATASRTQQDMARGFEGVMSYGQMRKFVTSRSKYRDFTDLLSYLENNGIRVTLVLSPYHPVAYKLFRKKESGHELAESVFRELAEEADIPILGSYDPEKTNCPAQEFYDGMHPKAECMARVVAKFGQE